MAGIPVLFAIALFAVFMVQRWQTRDERKLERLRDRRLWAEGEHPAQLRIQQEKELKTQAAELKRQAAELQKRAAGLRKQELREAIKQEEEHLREKRLHTPGPA